MKKYIRTKDDKIYCTNNLERNEILNRKPLVHKKTKELIYDTWIKQVADTIAELCDVFVVIDSQGHYIINNDERLNGRIIMALENAKIYGAVWTNEGLVFVAKMNRKGELELI